MIINLMYNMTEENIKSDWINVCNEYLRLFCLKHDYDYDSDSWVGSDAGTVAMIGDMYVSMEDIRYDIDNGINVNKFEEWYWKNLEVYELLEKNWLNYSSYCKGAPDPYSDEDLAKLRKLKNDVLIAQRTFEDELNKFKNRKE